MGPNTRYPQLGGQRMKLGFIIPQPDWGMPVPDIDISEWIDEEEEE